MKGPNHQTFAAALCVAVIALAGATLAVLPLPGQAEATHGLKKLQLSSYYDGEPVSVVAGAPSYSLPIDILDISNAWCISELELDDNAKEAIERNGFVVTRSRNPHGLGGLPYDDMVDPYLDLKDAGVPIFVTPDSLLHLYHVQFDEILKCVEEKEFFPKLMLMSDALFDESVRQYDSFSGELKEAARRNVGFFAVAIKLLGQEIGVPDYVSAEVNGELEKIETHGGFGPSDIFIYREDYSQYVPRGHYTRSETLKKYFKAMMWYGRMAFLLKGSASWGPDGEALISIEDARIQTIQASLIALALDSLQAEGNPIADTWNRIYAVTAFFVGLADDLTPYEYKESVLKVFVSPVNVEHFNDPEKMFQLKVELALLRNPKIFGGTGNCMIVPPVTPEKLDEVLSKTKGMRLMGQRFIPDSYMFQNLVLPVVTLFTGTGKPFTMEFTILGPMRCFPRGLDVMTVLGSDEALAILERDGDTDYVGYDESLSELMLLFDSLSDEEWNKNLYWSWLYTLKSLLGNYGQGYPAFMRGTPWHHKELNTALASWTELRHDTILYAKQSYTPPVTSVPPDDPGCVEPLPEFYSRLSALTRMTRVGLDDMAVLDSTQRDRLQALEDILNRLVEFSIAELEGRELSKADYFYIKNFGEVLKPLVEGISDEKGVKTTLIADVHTDGNTNQVLEEGVGYVKLMAVAYMVPDGRILLGAGPVFSYYEFKWPMSDRLTDEKWTEMLESKTNPAQPDWTKSFVHPVTFLPPNPDDTDDDHLSDAWEKRIWHSIEAVNNPEADYDNDGFTNAQEFRAGTDPADDGSFLRVVEIVPQEGGAKLRWSSSTGKRYQVFFSDDLDTWYRLGEAVVADGETAEMIDTTTGLFGLRFYRVSVLP